MKEKPNKNCKRCGGSGEEKSDMSLGGEFMPCKECFPIIYDD